jgi:hypothetical protein
MGERSEVQIHVNRLETLCRELKRRTNTELPGSIEACVELSDHAFHWLITIRKETSYSIDSLPALKPWFLFLCNSGEILIFFAVFLFGVFSQFLLLLGHPIEPSHCILPFSS